MRKKTKSPLIVFMVAIAAVLAFYNIYLYFTTNVKTEMVSYTTFENGVLSTGYSVRDEQILLDEGGGIINSYVSEGERVSKGTKLAAYYSGLVGADKQDKLKSLNDRILNLELLSSSESDRIIKTETVLFEKAPDIVKYAHTGHGTKLNEIKLEIEQAIDERIAINREDVSALIAELKKEKEEIEGGISGQKTDVYASETGLYFLNKDGVEKQFEYDSVATLSVKDFEAIDISKEEKVTSGVIKIVNNYEWRFVTVLPEKKVSSVKNGNTLKIRFPEHGNQVYKMSVIHISEAKDGKVLMVLQGTEYAPCVFSNRKLKCEVIFGSESGLKVNKKAIKVTDGKTGVYIVKSGIVRFREIDILAAEENYVVVSEVLDETTDNLLLYDEVVIKGNVEAGQMIK